MDRIRLSTMMIHQNARGGHSGVSNEQMRSILESEHSATLGLGLVGGFAGVVPIMPPMQGSGIHVVMGTRGGARTSFAPGWLGAARWA
jgi:hypothetical protein